MRLFTRLLLLTILLGTLPVSAAYAQSYEGTVALGGIFLDETGNRQTMVETYNIYEDFSVSQIRLTGNFNPQHYFALNLREVNLDSRKGQFVYRMPGRLKISTSYDQWRQIFDHDASVTSKRKDWRAGIDFTTEDYGRLLFNYNNQKKTGGRIGYPLGTMSDLGNQYDYVLQTGSIDFDYRQKPAGFGVAYHFANYDDKITDLQDRFGQVVSARIFGSAYFWPDKLTHFIRGSYGKQELTEANLKYDMSDFQYTGVVRPHERFQFKYNFYARRIDDQATGFETDNVQNNFDLTYYHEYGTVFAGYGYETNDNDVDLTEYNTFRLGGSANYDNRVKATLEWGTRDKQDVGGLTLLQDIESSKLLASLRYQALDDLYIGGKVTTRQRKFTTLNTEAEGLLANVYGGWEYPGWGSLVADYSYTNDDYDNLDGSTFKVDNKLVTARAQIDRVKDLKLVGGVTYMDVGEDLNIEKSILFFEGMYTFLDDYHVEVKYNIYNYDDYIVFGKYYTANVVWVNLAYDFRIRKD
jgi:hypothetical protein